MKLRRRAVTLDPGNIDPDAWSSPTRLLVAGLRALADELDLRDEQDGDAFTGRVFVVRNDAGVLGLAAEVEERPRARLRLVN